MDVVVRVSSRCLRLSAAVALGGFSPVLHAEFGTEFSIGRSDNIERLESGGRSEELVAVAVGGEAMSQGASGGRVRWALGGIDYRDGTYEDEPIVFVDGNARFPLMERRVFWNLSDQAGRQAVDPFVPVTPDTREYVNFFSTGPDFIAPISDAVSFNARLSYSDVWYENQDIGNSRNAGEIGIAFAPRPIQSFGVFVNVSEVSFDERDLYDDYDRHQVYVQYQTQRRRGALTASIGTSEIRVIDDVRDAAMLQTSWTRSVSGFASFALNAQRGFSDAGELFQFAQLGGVGTGTIDDVAILGEPIELSLVSMRLGITKPRISGALTYTWSRQEHAEANEVLDRTLPMWRFELSRALTPRVRLTFDAMRTRDDFMNTDREDTDSRTAVGVGWRLSSRSVLDFRLARFDRSSTVPGLSFEENRVFVTYGYGSEVAAVAPVL